MSMNYEILGVEALPLIQPLWEKLNQYHASVSAHFKQYFIQRTFDERRQDLLKKAERGKLRIILAKAGDDPVGYCISSISEERNGEVDTLYVEEACRHQGIGRALLQRALAWLEQEAVLGVRIVVAHGNERVIKMYEKHGFAPRAWILEQKKG